MSQLTLNQGRNPRTLTENIPIFRSILISSSFRTLETHRMKAFSQAYSLMLYSSVRSHVILSIETLTCECCQEART